MKGTFCFLLEATQSDLIPAETRLTDVDARDHDASLRAKAFNYRSAALIQLVSREDTLIMGCGRAAGAVNNSRIHRADGDVIRLLAADRAFPRGREDDVCWCVLRFVRLVIYCFVVFCV